MVNTKQFCIKLVHCGNKNLANKNDAAQKNVFFMPMGYFALANILKENQYDAEIIHSDFISNDEFLDMIKNTSIDAVGFDCFWVNQSLSVIETAGLIKKVRPDIFVFLGGYTASLFAKDILENHPQVDAIIRGDGEVPLIELCNRLKDSKTGGEEKKTDLSGISNLVWRDIDGNIKENDFSYLCTEEIINKLDFAAVDLLRGFEFYKTLSKFWTRFSPVNRSNMFLLEIGRGCQHACLFCGGNCEAQSIMNNRKKIVVRSIDSVIETIKKAKSFGYDTFYTCFEFQDSDQWFCSLFKRIKQENLSINFVYGSWGLPSKELIDAMAESCQYVVYEISPETSNENLRKKNKDIRLFYTNDELEERLGYINTKPNFKVQLYYGYYLVDDSEQTICESIDYILNLVLKYPTLLEVEYSNFSTDPYSLLYIYPEKYDIQINVRSFNDYLDSIRQNYVDKKDLTADMRLYSPRNITSDIHFRIERRIKLLNYLFSIYNKTISGIFARINRIDIVSKILDDTNLQLVDGVSFDSNQVKNKIILMCKEKGLIDNELLAIIESEYKNSMTRKVVKPVPKICLF